MIPLLLSVAVSYLLRRICSLNILLYFTLKKKKKKEKNMGFPGGTSGKESTCQCRRLQRHEFDPWVRKIPWRKKWQPTPVSLPGKFHEQETGVLPGKPHAQSMGSQRLDTTQQLTHNKKYNDVLVPQNNTSSHYN